jgi:hypothetical protein
MKRKKYSLDKICFIECEWNSWNGFFCNFLWIDFRYREGALFGLQISEEHFYIDLFFTVIKVYDKTDNNF